MDLVCRAAGSRGKKMLYAFSNRASPSEAKLREASIFFGQCYNLKPDYNG